MAAPVWALGCMSGTSMDGVDAAMVRTDGDRIFDFGPSAYEPFRDEEREAIRAALGRWPEEDGVRGAALAVEAAHLRVLGGFEGAELIGFHGQTLAHDPSGRGTHQAGSGARLARALGLPVVWDFRTADVRLGGQGAPLAPFFHFALARHIGAAAPLAFLNLGGIGNLTWVDPKAPDPQAPGALMALDTGPANAPIDDLMCARGQGACDRGGKLAAAGTPDEGIIAAVLSRAFFAKLPPKSLDRSDFADLPRLVAHLSLEDAAATLAGVAAAAVSAGLINFPAPPARVLVAGGGRHNAGLMKALGNRLPAPVEPVEAVGLDGDMLEAQAFAHLAVRVKNGQPTSAPSTTGVPAAVGGGTVSRP